MRIYFGHPINVFDTPLKTMLLGRIAAEFPSLTIVNPNHAAHSEGYARWKKSVGNGMDYYYSEVLPGCDAGVFLPFRDGKWGAGVYGEAKFMEDAGRQVYRIAANGIICAVRLDDAWRLGKEETIARIRTPEGIAIPY